MIKKRLIVVAVSLTWLSGCGRGSSSDNQFSGSPFVDARTSTSPGTVAALPAKVDSFMYADQLGFTPNTTMGAAHDGLFYIETSRPATINR